MSSESLIRRLEKLKPPDVDVLSSVPGGAFIYANRGWIGIIQGLIKLLELRYQFEDMDDTVAEYIRTQVLELEGSMLDWLYEDTRYSSGVLQKQFHGGDWVDLVDLSAFGSGLGAGIEAGRSAVTIPDGVTTLITWDSIIHQEIFTESTPLTVVTITEPGFYVVVFLGTFTFNAVGVRHRDIWVNGVLQARQRINVTQASDGKQGVTFCGWLVEGDTIAAQVFQSSGSGLAFSGSLAVVATVGVPGEPGSSGAKGDTGERGFTGIPGIQGEPGLDGLDGSSGAIPIFDPGEQPPAGDNGVCAGAAAVVDKLIANYSRILTEAEEFSTGLKTLAAFVAILAVIFTAGIAAVAVGGLIAFGLGLVGIVLQENVSAANSQRDEMKCELFCRVRDAGGFTELVWLDFVSWLQGNALAEKFGDIAEKTLFDVVFSSYTSGAFAKDTSCTSCCGDGFFYHEFPDVDAQTDDLIWDVLQGADQNGVLVGDPGVLEFQLRRVGGDFRPRGIVEGTDAALAITYVVTAGALDGNINWIGYDEFDEIVAQQTDAAVSGQLTTKGFLSGSVEIRRLKIKIDAFPGWETTADIRVMVAWVRESHIP